MGWTFARSDDPVELNRRIAFLQSSLSQRSGGNAFRPRYVPGRIILPGDVRSELPQMFTGVGQAGEHECSHNQWGAISVKSSNGNDVGIKPHECVVVSMTENTKWRE